MFYRIILAFESEKEIRCAHSNVSCLAALAPEKLEKLFDYSVRNLFTPECQLWKM